MRIKSNSDVIRDSDTNRERAKYVSIFFRAERGNGATYIQGEPAEDAGKDLNTIREKKYVQDETKKEEAYKTCNNKYSHNLQFPLAIFLQTHSATDINTTSTSNARRTPIAQNEKLDAGVMI